MQRYSVPNRTVRYNLLGYGTRVWTAVFRYLLYILIIPFEAARARSGRGAHTHTRAHTAAGPPPQVNVQSPPLTHSDQPITHFGRLASVFVARFGGFPTVAIGKISLSGLIKCGLLFTTLATSTTPAAAQKQSNTGQPSAPER